MAVNCDLTIIKALEYKHVFFELIDRQNPNETEYTISTYNRILGNAAERQTDSNEQLRLRNALNLDNLEHNGLLNYIDRHSGRFSFKEFFITMIRHLDSSRLRELSSAELNQLIKQLEELYRQISNPVLIWDEDEDDFKEVVRTVFDTFQSIFSALKSSVARLEGQSNKLASIIDDKDNIDMSRAEQVQRALQEILKMHERYITPTLQFLDNKLDLKRTITKLDGVSAPMQIVASIIDTFREKGFNTYVSRLQRIQLHMINISADMTRIEKRLDGYVKYAREERLRYNKVEIIYNQFKDALEETQHNKQKNKKIRLDNPVFDPIRKLGDFKRYSGTSSALAKWPNAKGTVALEELLRVKLDKAKKSDTKKEIVFDTEETDAITQQQELEAQRINNMTRVMARFKPEHGTDDAYADIHQHLITHLGEEYTLDMLFEAISSIKSNAILEWRVPESRAVIEHKNHRVTYKKFTFYVV